MQFEINLNKINKKYFTFKTFFHLSFTFMTGILHFYYRNSLLLWWNCVLVCMHAFTHLCVCVCVCVRERETAGHTAGHSCIVRGPHVACVCSHHCHLPPCISHRLPRSLPVLCSTTLAWRRLTLWLTLVTFAADDLCVGFLSQHPWTLGCTESSILLHCTCMTQCYSKSKALRW